MTALQLRPCQQECLDHAVKKNTIVSLPTGFGKTLIAAKLIEHYLKRNPEKKVAFLVPTRPLIEQQAAYCTTHCLLGNRSTVVQRLVGQDQADWQRPEWEECLRRSDIMLGTAAVLQKVLVTDKYLSIANFSLIIFDECHNAVGNSPMAAVMRDAVLPYAKQKGNGDCPRILGLTASFINGNLRNMEEKRQTLESLLLSTIICPSVEPKISNDRFKIVAWEKTKDLMLMQDAIAAHLEETLRKMGHIKEIKKVISRCSHVFTELGANALFFYTDKVIVQQIIDKASLLQVQDDAGIQCACRMRSTLPALREELCALKQRLTADRLLKQAPLSSNKLDKLVMLNGKLFSANDDMYRGIVFVEQVALVSALAEQMNGALAADQIRCGAVAGTSYQSQRERQAQLDKFKNGDIQVLIATATLEEGIDVSECAFVVRFANIVTTKAHIQGAGRARHDKAVIYYFENNPEIERQKEAAMTATAQNTSLSLTRSDFQSAMASMSVSVDQRHPYPFVPTTLDSGEVSVFNCKQIFNQYCSICLGTTVRPRIDLYRYSNKPGMQKILSSVRYPTPAGWIIITDQDYKQFWSGVDLDQVFSPGRVKRKSSSEKEEMCFVYIIVVKLREMGLLNHHNRPDSWVRFEIKRNCPLSPTEPTSFLSIKNTVFQSTS